MIDLRLACVLAGAALLAGAAPSLAGAGGPDFVAVERSASGEAWLLDGKTGSLWQQSGESPPTARVSLIRRGAALKWSQANGLAHIGGEWLVAGRRGKLERFSSDGSFLGDVALPAPVTGIVRSGAILWLIPLACPGPSRSFWVSRDGASFLEVPLRPDPADEIGTGARGLVDSMIIAGADGDEGLAFTRVIGGPLAFRIGADGGRRPFPLAYRRSRERDILRSVWSGDQDVADRSSPARDLVAIGGGHLVVLRNLEDVRGGLGVERRTGTVADRYDATGRHVSSAEFPEKLRLILRANGERVVGLSESGMALSRAFRARIPGGVQ